MICFGRTGSASTCDQDVRAAAAAGFRCLDLWAPKLDACLAAYPLPWLDAYLRQHNVYVTAISGLKPPSLYSPAEFIAAQAHLMELCTCLDALGGGIITVYPGIQDNPSGAPNTVEKASTAWNVHTLRTLSDLAAPFEVRLAFEFLGEARSSVRSLAYSQEIVRLVARNNVGLALSAHEFHRSEATLQEIDALDIDKLWLVHLAGIWPLPRGEPDDTNQAIVHGTAPVRDLCGQLAKRGFRGPYSIEIPPGDRPLAEMARLVRQAALDIQKESKDLRGP